MAPTILHIYKTPSHADSLSMTQQLLKHLQKRYPCLQTISIEECYNIQCNDITTFTTSPSSSPSSPSEQEKLLWLLSETFEPNKTSLNQSIFQITNESYQKVLEVGPRLAFSTAWSSNCLSMCQACGIKTIERIEKSRRYFLESNEEEITNELIETFLSLAHDRMTECLYPTPLDSFEIGVAPEPVQYIQVMEQGRQALEVINNEKGLGFDDWDLDYYTNLFREKLCRNPSDVECFDMAQSNSEHSRHWFFGGKMIIDGIEKEQTLFSLVKDTLKLSKSTLNGTNNSIIAFHDNSSAIRGFEVDTLTPADPSTASPLQPNRLTLHPILTAETHNFPSGVAPFPGAETGTGGRLRDVQATGRGAHTLAGICGYCVGDLHIPDNPMPWELEKPIEPYSSSLATPCDIEIQASNGASDYGNKFGEPVVTGFTRSFGQRLPSGQRIEWIKPIMFTAGVGMMDSRHAEKGSPALGYIVCKVGGPAYRIGLGGGAASSRSQGTVDSALDFNAVQRGDAEMENRMNRFIRACVEFGLNNPIISIHDQGAGGNGNVLKEIVDPMGAQYELRSIPVGDPTLSVMEIWGAEYQENNAILVAEENLELVLKIATRENCPVTPVGKVTGDGKVVVKDSVDNTTPFDLPLSLVLGKMPQKVFELRSPERNLIPLRFPTDITVTSALHRVLRLLDVGSKRFLTNKVDRSVTGLVAQQQCVGPLHTPLANVAVLAQSHFSLTGVATAVGEQPIKGLINNAAQARLTVGEALTNLVWAKITSLDDIKASCNWMWAAKLEGEGAKMWETCEAIRNILLELGPSIDGGKDSLSMAAKVGGETVVSPGEVTMTLYAPCPDITKTVTPDLKVYNSGVLYFIDLCGDDMSSKTQWSYPLGGTALSTVYNQLGDACSDVNDVPLLKRTFQTMQTLIDQRLIVSGHDRSDGGLIVTLLEMAFGGNCGIEIDINATNSPGDADHKFAIEYLFNENLGLVIEILPQNMNLIEALFSEANIPCLKIGKVLNRGCDANVSISFNNIQVLNDSVSHLRDLWESTSFALEYLQCNEICVRQERESLLIRSGPTYRVTYDLPLLHLPSIRNMTMKPKVAILRQEGTNGDREMCSAFYSVGFDVWDVNMNDLLMESSTINLNQFRGIVFCGGFSYADVNGSAKGWAATIRYHQDLNDQFQQFKNRPDTFSLGVCNGCQLMALLGWVPFSNAAQSTLTDEINQPRFLHNESQRFESRWCSVKIQHSKSLLLKNMENNVLGIWVQHGEGRLTLPDPTQLSFIQSANLIPLSFVDDDCNPTEAYPMNPNGSPLGIAGLCSEDGRHLAMMPHPERCFLKWQWPYQPLEWQSGNNHSSFQPEGGIEASPWIKLFQNAFEFCKSTGTE